MRSKRFIYALVVVAVPFAITILFHTGCANTTTPPSGGPKDTIPPILVGVKPYPYTTLVPTKKTKLEYTFNEYVVIKNKQNIYLSPPLEKAPKSRISEKKLIVTFESDLDSNKTYVLDLTNAIADNNEGNMFPGFTHIFSTGSTIDSMMVTGTVLNSETLLPEKDITVMLYKDHSDSAIFKHRPDASIKTDEWGYFALRNIQDTLYRMYAIKDENSNNVYDPDNDMVAFIDSLIRPVNVVNDTIKELLKYDMKDTLACAARKSEYQMLLFKEVSSKQMIIRSVRDSYRQAHVTFMAPNVVIDTMWIRGVKPAKLLKQFNRERDSVIMWINDPGKMPDTLFLNIKYEKTDTLGNKVMTLEKLKLGLPLEMSSKARFVKKEVKKEDTLAVYKVNADGDRVEQYGIEMEFNFPLIVEGFDSLKFTFVNPRQQKFNAKLSVTKDPENARKYVLKPKTEWKPGFEYFLKIPKRVFRDVNGYYNDSLDVKIALPTDELLSSLTTEMEGVNGKYIVDLLDEKRTKVIRSFEIRGNTTLKFPYIKSGKYCIRITEDINDNGIIDTGCLLEKRQSERVRFYKLGNGNIFLDIPASTDITQTINVTEVFK